MCRWYLTLGSRENLQIRAPSVNTREPEEFSVRDDSFDLLLFTGVVSHTGVLNRVLEKLSNSKQRNKSLRHRLLFGAGNLYRFRLFQVRA